MFETISASAPAAFRGLPIATDVAGVGRELHPDRLVGGRADALDHVESVILVQREIAAIGIARRAGDVDLDHVDRRTVPTSRVMASKSSAVIAVIEPTSGGVKRLYSGT